MKAKNMDEQLFSVAFLPSGKPAPVVLTAEETIELLRLDGNGERTLKYYRDTGQLTGIRLGKKVQYPLSEIMKFLGEKANKSRAQTILEAAR